MKLSCLICATWTVEIAGAQTWTAPDGRTREFVTGRCGTCQSVQLVDPSTYAVERVASLVKAAEVAAKAVAGPDQEWTGMHV